jgi:hypothetical protein
MSGVSLGMPLLALWAACFGAVALGGVVKGTLGVGLPLVVVPLLSLLLPAPQAMGLLVMPVLLSNLWQATESQKLGEGVKRFGGLLISQLVATIAAIHFTRNLSVESFNLLLALAVMVAVGMMILGASFQVSRDQERWMGPLVGAIAGVMAGVSSLTGPILITYLLALQLRRDEFIGSISIIYLFGSIPMYATMMWYDRFGVAEVGLSCLALIPMFLGLRLGRVLRHMLSEAVFRRLLFGLLTVLSVLLVLK